MRCWLCETSLVHHGPSFVDVYNVTSFRQCKACQGHGPISAPSRLLTQHNHRYGPIVHPWNASRRCQQTASPVSRSPLTAPHMSSDLSPLTSHKHITPFVWFASGPTGRSPNLVSDEYGAEPVPCCHVSGAVPWLGRDDCRNVHDDESDHKSSGRVTTDVDWSQSGHVYTWYLSSKKEEDATDRMWSNVAISTWLPRVVCSTRHLCVPALVSPLWNIA